MSESEILALLMYIVYLIIPTLRLSSPHKCTYCASPFHWDRRTTRLRSPESVIEEMKILKKASLIQKAQPKDFERNSKATIKVR